MLKPSGGFLKKLFNPETGGFRKPNKGGSPVKRAASSLGGAVSGMFGAKKKAPFSPRPSTPSSPAEARMNLRRGKKLGKDY